MSVDNMTKKEELERCIQCVAHCCQCVDPGCHRGSCNKLKSVIQHTKICNKETSECPVCKQFILLCCYHSKKCEKSDCHIPYCMKIRQRSSGEGENGNRLVGEEIEMANVLNLLEYLENNEHVLLGDDQIPGPSHA